MADVLGRLEMCLQIGMDNGQRLPNALDTDGTSNMAIVEQLLMDCSRRVHQEGRWVFNQKLELTLSPDVTDDKVYVPEGCLFIDMAGDDIGKDIVQRGEVLYDRTNDTEEFDDDVVVTVKNLYLPECADPHIRDYILADASWSYAMYRTDNERASALWSRREQAKRRAYTEELDKSDSNFLRGTDAAKFRGEARTQRIKLRGYPS